MRLAGIDDRRRSLGCMAAMLVSALALAGCSSSTPDSSISFGQFSNYFSGSSSQAAAPQPGATPFNEEDCPSLDIRAGASTLMNATKTQDPTAADLRYQLSFTRLARQCFAQGGVVTMKVGVQGRVVVGPAGAPTQVDVPVRFAVMQEGVAPKPIMTKFKRFAVAMPPGETNVIFSDVEDNLSFPMPSLAELQAYVVYVGFDEIGDRNEKRPAPKKKSAPRKQ